MLRQNGCKNNSSTFRDAFLPDDSTGWDDGFKVTSAQGDKNLQAVLHFYRTFQEIIDGIERILISLNKL